MERFSVSSDDDLSVLNRVTGFPDFTEAVSQSSDSPAWRHADSIERPRFGLIAFRNKSKLVNERDAMREDSLRARTPRAGVSAC